MTTSCDIAIVGAGAAGLAAAYFAGEAAAGRGLTIALLEGARRPGAKILVSGGGRCNVTHRVVTPDDFWGGPRPTIRNVLRAFDERATLAWMRSLGVDLKLEETGKYFPVSDQARTVLDALLEGAARRGVRLMAGFRVASIASEGDEFHVTATTGDTVRARRLIMATGGRSLPKSGSDGWGLEAMRRRGHTIVPTTPALVPLVLRAVPPSEIAHPGARFAELAGITLDVALGLYDAQWRPMEVHRSSMLFTHFGVSGPAAMDLSRHWLRARLERPGETFHVALGHPEFDAPARAEAWLDRARAAAPRRGVASALADLFPDRLARALADGHDQQLGKLTRPARAALAARMTRLPLDVAGDRGWSFAETTAGGVDLREVDHRTMASRVVPGVHLCGEMLDVDGRIGGFSFQWAWASGHQAGRGAVAALARTG